MSNLLSTDPKALQLLFNEDLYAIQPAVSQPAVQAPAEFDYLGENNRFFLLLVDEPGEPYLEKENLALLTKILQAKSLELKDVAILNVNAYPGLSFSQLKSFFSCSRVCLFGIDPKPLALPDLPSNEAALHEDVRVLATFSLKELQQTQHKKVAFWNAMKIF